MGMLDRIKKKQFEGLKEFVQSMEITAPSKRGQIFTAGVLEDPIFMGWVMKNIKTFNEVLNLPSAELRQVVMNQAQTFSVFVKAISKLSPEKMSEVEGSLPELVSQIRDELSYHQGISDQEVDSAKYHILKVARKLQYDERINGFSWNLPPQDVFFAKTHRDGVGEIYFETSVLAAKGEYFKNRRSGEWTHFYETGKVLAQGEYKDGLKVGLWTFYYGDGKMKSQGMYLNDSRHGIWNEWDRFGVCSEVQFQEGVKLKD